MRAPLWVAAGILAVLILLPQAGDGCGPFIPEMKFTAYHGLLEADVDTGQYTVVRPHFYRRELLLAYRAFSGVPLPQWGDTLDRPQASANAEQDWLKGRREVPGAAPIDRIDIDRKVPGADYQFYANCLDGAFQSAADTLHKRIAQWGASSPQTAEWLRAQDQVFQNCSAGATIPASAPDADRQYQIAAAEFYSEQYDHAESDFDSIAGDAKSPWHDIAPYLAARACIRHATIGGVAAKMAEAEKRLRAVIDDPTGKPLHDSARGLLEFVRDRTEPRQRLVELGNQLMKPKPETGLGRILTDYTTIWDRLEQSKGNLPVKESDVADWIAAFQQGGADWRGKSSLPWLIAALRWAPDKDPSAADLLRSARAVPPDSPAYPGAVYYGVLREIRAGQLDAGRQWADDALPKTKAPSAINLLRAERLRLASDWAEFLRFAVRKPVGSSVFDGDDDPITGDEAKAHPAAFDADFTESLNRAAPLARWADAGRSSAIPAALQAPIARAGWVRAVLLGDTASAKTLAQRVIELSPELRTEMRAYLAATDPAQAQFTAVFLMLRGPGFEPVIRPGFGRQSKIMERDILRDNLGPHGAQAHGRRRDRRRGAPRSSRRDLRRCVVYPARLPAQRRTHCRRIAMGKTRGGYRERSELPVRTSDRLVAIAHRGQPRAASAPRVRRSHALRSRRYGEQRFVQASFRDSPPPLPELRMDEADEVLVLNGRQLSA